MLVQHDTKKLKKRSKKLKNRIQTLLNKCIRFCLQLDKMSHISQKEFETINWLPIKERYNQCVNSIAFKYFDNQYPHYLHEVFMKAPAPSNSSLRNSFQKLQQPFRKTLVKMSFIGPALWNKVPEEIKRTTNLNAFKGNLKKHYLKELGMANFSKKLSLSISLVWLCFCIVTLKSFGNKNLFLLLCQLSA